MKDILQTDTIVKYSSALTPLSLSASESVPNDDLFEKSVNMVTTVMHLEGTDDKAHFTTIHENSNHMLKTVLLDTKKVLYVHCICDHACINQPLGAKVEFSERREIANAFTIIAIHFQYLIIPRMEDSIKDQLENRFTQC